MYVCIHIYIYIYTHTHIHTYIHLPYLKMASCLLVSLNNPGSVTSLEYIQVTLSELGREFPHLQAVRHDEHGLARIDLNKGFSPFTHCLVLVVTGPSGNSFHGLISGKHFLMPFIEESEGHAVWNICGLPMPPIAWVRPSDVPWGDGFEQGTFMGKVLEHEVKNILKCVYASLRLAVCYMPAGPEVNTAMVQAMAALAAPLAFKALYEQGSFPTLAGKQSLSQPWGNSFFLHRNKDGGLSCTAISQLLDKAYEPTNKDILMHIRLVINGLQLSRYKGNAGRFKVHIEEIEAHYWAICLAALCCDAARIWSRLLKELHSSIKASRSLEGQCQRCGFSYTRDPRVACPKDPLRVPGVKQIDRVLLGITCTTLCAEVLCISENNKPTRYCVNHQRKYKSGVEEIEESTGQHVAHRSYESEEDACWALWQCLSRYERKAYARHRGGPLCIQARGVQKVEIDHIYDSIGCCAGDTRVSEGPSRSAHLWRGFSCQVLGYHIKVIPLGFRGRVRS